MKVLFVTHSSELMGAERSLIDMLSGFDSTKVEPLVLLGRRGPLVTKLDEQGVRHVMIPYLGDTISLSPFKPSWVKRAVNDVAVPQVVRLLRREHIDLVHCNSILADVGMRSARRAGIPYVCHIRDHGKADHGIEFIDSGGVARLVADADRVIAISDSVRRLYEPLVESDNFVTIHDGVDADTYRFEHGVLFAKESTNMLLAGRIEPGKGQLEAVRATEILMMRGVVCKLVIIGSVGNADYETNLRDYISMHSLWGVVELRPFVQNLSKEYLRSDIALVCSTCEAFGRVTVEGMLAGCLVIGARAGATPEIITDGQTGLLYESGNPEDLANKIQWAVSNKGVANAIALDGQQDATATFDNHAYAKRIESMYSEILASPLC